MATARAQEYTDPSVPGPSRGLLGWLRDRWHGWVGPKDAQATPAGREVEAEQVHAGPSGIVFPWFLPYLDEQTGETQAARAAYRRMLADPNVKAALLGKILDVAALDLRVRPANKLSRKHRRVADFVRWDLEERLQGGMPELIWSVLSGGLIDGYSVCEKVFSREENGKNAGLWPLTQVKAKDVGNDVVLRTDSYRNVVSVMGLRYNAGLDFSPARFLIYRHLSLYRQPTGMSDLRAVYGRYWLLDTVLKLRGINAEKRAMPFLVGTYQATSQKPTLEAMLARAKSQNWASVPEGVKLEAVNIAGSADDVFAGFVKDLKHDIFLGIQGAILQALEGSVIEGRGNSKVHRSTADLIVWYLASTVQSLLNDRDSGLIKDVVDLNFVVSEYPRATLSAIDPAELLQEAELDHRLWEMGLELSKEDMYERYGRVPPESDEDAIGKDAGGPGGGPGGLPGGDDDGPPPGDGPGDDEGGEGEGPEPLDFGDAPEPVTILTTKARRFAETPGPDAILLAVLEVLGSAERDGTGSFADPERVKGAVRRLRARLARNHAEQAERFAGDAAGRKVGEKWEGKGGRWFTKNDKGRVVPTSNPNKQAPAKKAAAKKAGGPERAPKKSAATKKEKYTPERAREDLEAHLADPTSITPESVAAVAGKLSGLTVPQLKALGKELGAGLKGLKADLVRTLAAGAYAAAGKAKGPEEKPAPKPEPKPGPAKKPARKPAAKADPRASVADAILSHPGKMVSVADLAERTGMPLADLHRAIDEMRGKGLLTMSASEGHDLPDAERDRLRAAAIDDHGEKLAYVEVRDGKADEVRRLAAGAGKTAPPSALPEGDAERTLNHKGIAVAEKAAARVRLDAGQKRTLREYSHEWFDPVNRLLRGEELEDPGQEGEARRMIADIDRAMRHAELPEPVLVHRALSLEPSQVASALSRLEAAAEAGGSIRLDGFQSTTLDPDVLSDFGARGGLVFEISASRGLYLEGLGKQGGEQELLLPHGGSYRVAAVKKASLGAWSGRRTVVQLIQEDDRWATGAGSSAAGGTSPSFRPEAPKRSEPAPAKAPAKAVPPIRDPAEALDRTRKLYDRILTEPDWRGAIDELAAGLAGLSAARVADLARSFGLERKFPGKQAAIKGIAQKIEDRRGAYERAQV